jgi:regulator of protease activity HflC (stomatin/prohibitin superfamily)
MNQENSIRVLPGLPLLLIHVALWVLGPYVLISAIGPENGPMALTGLTLLVINAIFSAGFFVVEPNGSKVLLLFGNYKGTVKEPGLWFGNPFFTKRNLSLRVRTLNGERLKVNDASGNPIEIATIVVWQVSDTFKASFDVENYEDYVTLQSETALRHNASTYAYDAPEGQVSLMKNADEVGDHLRRELAATLKVAGVEVIDAKLSHLAYAPEIAGAMLRRQQAEAVIAARQKIVDGAVSMVEMALSRIEKEGVIQMDDERKAAMVSNLMVVLCSEHSAQPVVNAGTLYG